MCHNKVFNFAIGDDKIIVDGVVNINNVKPLEIGDILGVYLHEESGTVIIARYEDGKMIRFEKSSASPGVQ